MPTTRGPGRSGRAPLDPPPETGQLAQINAGSATPRQNLILERPSPTKLPKDPQTPFNLDTLANKHRMGKRSPGGFLEEIPESSSPNWSPQGTSPDPSCEFTQNVLEDRSWRTFDLHVRLGPKLANLGQLSAKFGRIRRPARRVLQRCCRQICSRAFLD